MPIRPEEIDLSIQSALKERLSQIFVGQGAQDPLTARVRSAGTQKWRETFHRFPGYLWAGGLSLATGFFSFAVLEPTNEGLAILTWLSLTAIGTCFIIDAFTLTQQELTRFVSPEAMRGASHLISLSRAEQLYCEAVAALIEAAPVLGETVQGEILQQLNGLLESHRKLDIPIRRYAASASVSVETLEDEIAGLNRRREELTDAAAREMMDQSIALCGRRLEQAKALKPAREQAEAQQELILQTLASVAASLTRTGAVPSAPVSAEVTELQESVTQANRRAQAVEEAVAEVMALNA